MRTAAPRTASTLAACSGTVLLALAAGCKPAAEVELAQATAPSVALAAVPYAPDSGTVAIRCARVIDGLSDAPTESATVLIEKGRITAVGQDIVRGEPR